MRKRIYEIIEKAEDNDIVSTIYDYSMIFVILASLIPLTLKNESTVFTTIDKITVNGFHAFSVL